MRFPPRLSLLILAVAAGWPVATADAQRLESLWYLRGEQSIQSFLRHAYQIAIVAPQVFTMDSTGAIRGQVDPRVIETARAKRVKLMPLVMNPGFDQPTIHRVLTVPEARKRALESLVASWPAVVDQVRQSNAMLAALLADARPVALAERDVTVAFPTGAAFLKRKAEQDDHRRATAEALRSVTGAMPAYFCSSSALLNRSRCSPKAASRRGARQVPAPGKSSNNA